MRYEETEIPVKLFQAEEKTLDIRPFRCLICGKQPKNDCMRQPQEKEVKAFNRGLVIRKQYNDCCITDYEY